jgi:hypothetical protein
MKFSSIILGLIIAAILNNSCKQSQSISSSLDVYQNTPDSIKLIIRAIDLTEDMSSLSSNNDELNILVYEVIDSLKRVSLKYSSSFTLTKQSNIKQLSYFNTDNLSGKIYSIVLIERDTDQSTNEIEKMISSRYFEIASYYFKKGNFGIEEFIGDNDIIGIKSIHEMDRSETVDFGFRGFFKLDKYEYRLTLMKSQ